MRPRWDALPTGEKRNVVLEDLCEAAGVTRSDFVVAVAAIAVELGIDMAGIMETDVALRRLASEAMTSGGFKAREQFFEAEKIFGWRG